MCKALFLFKDFTEKKDFVKFDDDDDDDDENDDDDSNDEEFLPLPQGLNIS